MEVTEVASSKLADVLDVEKQQDLLQAAAQEALRSIYHTAMDNMELLSGGAQAV
jgi:DNA-binding protein YbaB